MSHIHQTDKEQETTTYRVPVRGYAGVYVVADDKDEAIDEAIEHIDSAELTLSTEINPDTVHADEPVGRSPVNVDTDDSNAELPDVPSVTRLREYREQIGLSLREVADYLDRTASTVGSWERQEHSITLEQARHYREVLSDLSDEE